MTLLELTNRKDNKVYWVKGAPSPEEFTYFEDVVIATTEKEFVYETVKAPCKMTPDLPVCEHSHLGSILWEFAEAGRIDDIIRTLEESLKEIPLGDGTVYRPTEEERVAISEFLEGMKGVETGTTITDLGWGLLAHFEQDTIIIDGTPITFYLLRRAVEKMTRDKQLIILGGGDPRGEYEEAFGDRLEVYETLEWTIY